MNNWMARRVWLLPLAVFAVGCSATLLLAWQAGRIAHEKDTERFQNAVEQTTDTIRDRINIYIALLRGLAGYLATADTVSREEFQSYVARLNLKENYPGIQGIGFSRRIEENEKDELLEQLVREGVTHKPPGKPPEPFKIWQSHPAPETHAIVYLQPLDERNHNAIGYNMYSEPIRREAMSRARDLGGPAASGRVTLVQEIDAQKQAGFLIYVPLYEGGLAPATLEERRETLVGFAYSPFRADDLLGAILKGQSRPRIQIDAYDETISPDARLHRSHSNNGEWSSRFQSVADVDVAGRTWKLVLSPTPDFDLGSAKGFVPWILLGGIMLSGLLAAVTFRESSARANAELAMHRLSQATEELSRSAARNDAILAGAIDSIVTMDREGRVIEFNPAAERLFHYPRAEAIGKTMAELLIPPAYREAHRNGLVRYLETGEARVLGQRLELTAMRKSGEEFPVELTVTRNPGAGGPTFTGFIRDVSELRATEKRLKEESATIEIINRVGASLAGELELSRVLQSVTDACTRLVEAKFGAFFYNHTDEQGESYLLFTISGVEREKFSKFPLPRNTELFGPTFRGEGVVRMADVRKDTRFGKNPPYNGLPAGHLPVVSYMAAPVVSRSGEVIGGLFFGHDRPGAFRERHEEIVVGIASQAAVAIDNARLYKGQERALRAARQANVELEKAGRLKDEFLGTLSHELRTPLNAILGFATYLQMANPSKEEIHDGLATIERNARVQAKLIEDLLDMNRIISGKLRLDVQQVDLHKVIEAAITTVQPSAESKEIQIQKVLDPSAEPVRGDPHRLQQIIWNLLSNAIKFSSKGGKVQVLLERVDSQVEIGVVDGGQGISSSFLPHVFDRFSQADGSTTRTHGGLGIGLSIVKQLVELHGGTVAATSPGENQGSTFRVRLPVAAVHTEGAVEERLHPVSSDVADNSWADTIDLSHLCILVVDDDRDAGEIVKRMLEQRNAIVTTSLSAAEALSAFSRCRPDVLISDIGMPGEDGYSLIRKVRSRPVEEGGETPAVALTAFARSEDRARAALEGFQAHVSKPVEPSELIAIVASLGKRPGA